MAGAAAEEVRTESWPVQPHVQEFLRRALNLRRLRGDVRYRAGAREYYRTRGLRFATDWGVTYDPRNAGTDTPALLPWSPFRRQRELTLFIYDCVRRRASGLIEKSRDMGATWDAVIVSVHLFLFWDGVSVGWGSRKASLVDQIGNPDSIFEKIRIQLRHTPTELLPEGFSLRDHMSHMRIVNPETGATIVGEAGDDIGRGGRSSIYFLDEAAHVEHPEAIEAALNDNANTRIDISSVNGLGNVFQRKRESGTEWDRSVGAQPGVTNVFVMDWSHHPGKTPEWYAQRRAKAEREGLLHVFAQEVDRDYSAAVQGTVIPAAWVRTAIDAHVRLEIPDAGRWHAALDVADEGGDRNALATRRGVIVRSCEEWGARDTGVTTRRAVDACAPLTPLSLQYDCVGVGSGVKSEANRLAEDDLMPKKLRLVPWNAGEGPQAPDRHMVIKPDGSPDKDSPTNGEFFANLKAQGWWQLRRRFELTHRVITLLERGVAESDGAQLAPRRLVWLGLQAERRESGVCGTEDFTWDADDLISLPSDLPSLWKLVKELSQPTMSRSTRMKLLIDKAPDGTSSPNLADAVMMCFWPVTRGQPMEIPEGVIERAQVPTTRVAAQRHRSRTPPRSRVPALPPSPEPERLPQLRSTRPPVAEVEIIR